LNVSSVIPSPPSGLRDANTAAPAFAPVTAAAVDAAGQIYLAGVRASGPLDQAVADALKRLRRLDDVTRAFAVDTAQAMFRQRSRIDDAARRLPFAPTRHALVCLFLAGARGLPSHVLPGDPRLTTSFAQAWHASDHAPLALRASIPEWLAAQLVAEHGDGAQALCLSFIETPPTTLRTNTLLTDRDALQRMLADEGLDAETTAVSPHGLTLLRRANVFRTRAFRDGWFEAQDEGSQMVSLCCGAKPGMTVVDACAGAGGKTLHLAALMGGKGTLWALDVHGGRLRALRERARRAGAHNIRVAELPDPALFARLEQSADVVLVDAPCSGSGVLRRNPDTAWTLTPDAVERMAAQQRALLDSSARMVKPGGRLVYATCSLLRDENDAQVEAFLLRTAGFVRMDAGVRTAPTDPARWDGFFAAVLERSR
jgi:16S rRNA (cytosine967-C5)-methyltransferase